MDQLYEYSEFKYENGEPKVWFKGSWRLFIPVENRLAVLLEAHGPVHLGYTKMLNSLEGVHWPDMSEEIRDFLSSCRCSLMKQNRRKLQDFESPKKIPALQEAAYCFALDLFSWKDKHFLSILDLKNDLFYSLEVASKSKEEITVVLLSWAQSLDIPLSEAVCLTDRGGEFDDLSLYLKDVVKTASYSPQANGSVERRHKELAMLCRLYDKAPNEVASLLNSRLADVNFIKHLPAPGELILRYEARIHKKEENRWTGPYVVLKSVGKRMVEAVNLDSKRTVVLHLNDIKQLKRPSLIGISAKKAFLEMLDSEDCFLDFRGKVVCDWPSHTKEGIVFIDIFLCKDFPDIVLDKSIRTDIAVAIPEWREETFFEIHEAIPGEFVECRSEILNCDANDENALNFNFKIWIGIYKIDDIRKNRSKVQQILSTGGVWWQRLLESPGSC